MAYIGVSPSNGVRQKHTYTATASQTTFSGAGSEGISLSYRDSNYVDVYRNGVKLGDADYTATSGTSIVLGEGAAVNDIVEIIAYDVFSVADTVSKADGGTFDGNVTMAGTLGVTGETTLSTHLNMGDSDIIKLGDDADLQIYHDASNSQIINSVGHLNIDNNGDDKQINLRSDDGSGGITNYIRVNGNTGAVQLYHYGSTKFATTSAGIDVTGLVVSDGMQTNTAGANNFIAGINAGISITSGGNFNVAVGDYAGTSLTLGDGNVAIGYEALRTEDANGENTAVGYRALKTLNAGASGLNTAIGYNAALSMTTGVQNIIIGAQAGDGLTDADYNVAVGAYALTSDTQGSKSTAIGWGTLVTQNFSSATDSYNTAIGYNAGYSVTTGIENVLIGGVAGDALTDADFNIAIGVSALTQDTRGSKTVAIGGGALNAQNFTSATDTHNVAVGFHAGNDVTTGIENTLIGSLAGDSITSSSANTLVGQEAGHSITTGDGRNTFIGNGAGSLITSGVKNSIIGRYSGNAGGLDIRTSDNYIVLSDGDGNPRQITNSDGTTSWTINASDSDRVNVTSYHAIHNVSNGSPALVIENSADSTPNGLFIDLSDADPDNNTQYFIKAEGSSGTERFKVFSDGDVVNHDNSYGSISDAKLKEQITDASSQWEDIKALSVRKYKMKSDVATGDSDAHWRLGLIAQEVETAGMNGLVKTNPDMIENEDGVMVDSGTTTKTVKYSILYMKAVKALQEAMERIETLEQKVATLEGA